MKGKDKHRSRNKTIVTKQITHTHSYIYSYLDWSESVCLSNTIENQRHVGDKCSQELIYLLIRTTLTILVITMLSSRF